MLLVWHLTLSLIEYGLEQREGWSLLTVETEVNGDSKSPNESGHCLVGSLVLPCKHKRFLFCMPWLL